MTDRLEEKLRQFENGRSISNKSELEEAINSIIESELSNTDDLVDFDLIDEATDFLLYLDGKDDDALEYDIERIIDSIIDKQKTQKQHEFSKNSSYKITSKKNGVRKKWIIPLVAVISILAAIVITC